jgi:Mor family transcriptional regulator
MACAPYDISSGRHTVGYKKSTELPTELIKKIQEYVDGETVYIPRKSRQRRKWGESTGSISSLDVRNAEIYKKYLNGKSVKELSEEYYISKQGIYKILTKFK